MSDWQTAITQACAELDKTFGESATRVRLSEVRSEYVETQTGAQKVLMRSMTVDKSARSTVIARGTAVIASDATYAVRELTNEDAASRTYIIVK
jgi:hypothetical protein